MDPHTGRCWAMDCGGAYTLKKKAQSEFTRQERRDCPVSRLGRTHNDNLPDLQFRTRDGYASRKKIRSFWGSVNLDRSH